MLYDSFFSTWDPEPAITGPFATEDDLIRGMIRRYEVEGGPRLTHKTDYYRRTLPKVLKTEDGPIFSHGDLQRKNIIVQPDGKVVIVDWATAGWYPSYWEYAVAMFANGGWDDDWHQYLAQILDEYPNQYVWINMMRTELWS